MAARDPNARPVATTIGSHGRCRRTSAVPAATEVDLVELGLRDTNGILRQPWIRPTRTSAGLGWPGLYVSTQREAPYRADFDAAATHLLILHRGGPVTVSRGHGRLTSSREVPPGGLFLHPAGRDLTVELGGDLDTVHVYLADEALQAASGRPHRVELAEELGASDPLLEQLTLALDGVLRDWQPSARTYVDHLSGLLAAHLAHCYGVRRGTSAEAKGSGLAPRQLHAVRSVMRRRIAEPLPLAELAAVAGLSVSQFTRQFKTSTGQAPHQFLLRLRLEVAARALRTSERPIAEVAASCGFSHQEHLTRVMRARLGTTPAALRRAG
ncbi:MAG TPA: AraC family transcriptional regulator [Pseudonocardiaceae bacterium]|jgi:AraC family transcriptional regulator|nr:AraC family transcriptional regulator [Pseudonocardiaceae bacterium]